jgi:hypothetical protein
LQSLIFGLLGTVASGTPWSKLQTVVQLIVDANPLLLASRQGLLPAARGLLLTSFMLDASYLHAGEWPGLTLQRVAVQDRPGGAGLLHAAVHRHLRGSTTEGCAPPGT